jgi:hypothetical protein
MKKETPMNPFVFDRKIDVVAIKVGSTDDENIYVEKNKYYVERQRRTSIYYDTHYDIDEILFGKLTSKARDLYWYIVYHLPEGKDCINLKISDVRGKTGISRNAIVTALQSLKNANLITPKSQSIYWVNPMYVFKGNRLEYFKSLGDTYLNVVSIIKK